MRVSELATDVEHGLGESQNQRDARVEELWTSLEPDKTGELDLKGLKKGLWRIDHREGKKNSLLCGRGMLTGHCSYEECGRYAQTYHE